MQRAIIPTEEKTQTTTQQLEFLLGLLISLGISDLPIWEIFGFLNVQDFFLIHSGSIFPRQLKIKCFNPRCNDKAILPNLACRNCLECDICGRIFGPFKYPSSKRKDGKFICHKCPKKKICFTLKKMIDAIQNGKEPEMLELSTMICNTYCNSRCVIEGKFFECPIPYHRHYCKSNNSYNCRCKGLKPCKYHFLKKGCKNKHKCTRLHKCDLCEIGVHKSICPYKEPL